MQRGRAMRRGGGGSRAWLWVLGGVWGLLVLGLLGCVVGGVAWVAWLMRSPNPVEREVLLAAPCEGGAQLSFVLEVTKDRLAGATTHTDFVGEWVTPSTAARKFSVHGDPPRLRVWPRHTLHGDGPEYISFFLAPPMFSDDDAARIERCTEANAPALLRAIDANNARPSRSSEVPMSRGAPALGRGRIYWRVDASVLAPVYREGQRTLTVWGDGAIFLEEPWSAGGFTGRRVGEVTVQPDGSITLRCCEQGETGPVDLSRFRDAQGRTLVDVVGAQPVPL